MSRPSGAWGPWVGGLLLAAAVAWRGAVDAPAVVVFATLFIVCWGVDAALRRRAPWLPWASRGASALALFSVLSAVPLPPVIVRLLSPRAVELASMPPLPAPSLVAFSLDPPASLVEGAKWAGIAALVAWAARSSRRRARSWAWALVAVSLLGGVLNAAGIRGAGLVNPNHVASLTLIGALLAMGIGQQASGNERSAAIASALLLGGATIATGSQAGSASLVVGVTLFAAWSQRERLHRSLALALGAALVVGAVLTVTRDAWWSSALGKLRPWPHAWRMALAHPWVGVGRGAFGTAFEAWTPEASGVVYTHPETIALQWACEWGLPVTLLALVGGFAWLSVSHPWREGAEAVRAAAFIGVVSVLLHEFADFGLETGGVAFVWAACVGLAATSTEKRMAAPGARWSTPGVRWSALAVASAAALLGWSSLRDPCDDVPSMDVRLAQVCIARHPADAAVALRAARTSMVRAADGALSAEVRREALSEAFAHAGRAQVLTNLPAAHFLSSELLLLAGRRSQAMVELGVALRAGADAGEVATRAAAASATADELEAVVHPVLEERRPQVAADFLRALGLHPGRARETFAAAFALWDEDEAWREPELFAATCVVGLAAASSEVGTLAAQMRARHPNHPGGWWCGSEALRRSGETSGALALLEEGVVRVPSDVGLSLSRARLLIEVKRPVEAEALVRALPEPGDAGLAEIRAKVLYDALMADGRPHRALADMRAVAASRDLWRLDLLARALADAGAWDEAEVVRREASRIARPEDASRLAALRRRLDDRPAPTSGTLAK